MMTLPNTILTLLSNFALAFSRPVWKKVQVLFTGSTLTREPRRVSLKRATSAWIDYFLHMRYNGQREFR